jgi:uncharacterized protein involved in exopolysaccharide biosynthesis
MTDQSKQIPESPWVCDINDQGGVDLYHYWRVIWKRRKIIGCIIAAAVFAALVGSLFMTNIYQAKAVIIPVTGKDSGGGNPGLAALAQQLGGIPGVPSSPSATASEIVSLLNSNILKQKMIEQHNLMPILFYRQWDNKQQTWKQGHTVWRLMPFKYFNVPDTWDALRLLEKIVKINRNNKDNTITISVDFHDPKLAAQIVDYYLVTLTDYMSSEVKRVAASNRKYLEEQLGSTTDPFIKQKTYNMIAQQIETGMMAEVKENFAFKVIDPPLAPDKKIKPQRVQIVLLSLVLSLIIGIGIALFMECYEKVKIKDREVRK